MTALGDERLIELLNGGESERVEMKESLRGGASESAREAICAFSNDLPGYGEPGAVFVGVRDDGSPTGAAVSDETLRQLADMKTDGNILPPPSMTVRKMQFRGAEIAAVVVQPSDSPPVRFRGRIHIRIGPRRGVVTAQDERILNERRRHGDIPFDTRPLRSTKLSDLDTLYFEREYLTRAFAPDILEANDRSIEERLAATKMIHSPCEPIPTVLGILVLGKDTQRFLPGAYVQFLRFGGAESFDVIDSQEIRGTVADVLRRLDDKLVSHNRVAVDFISAPIERRTSPYPIEAIRQIVRNAVMHRAYEGTNAPVHVHWRDDRIEIISPGGLFGAVTRDSIGKGGAVDYRNPNLADAMKTLGFVQRFGLGIPLAQRLLRESGNPPAEFSADASNVRALIRALPGWRS